jgi:molybdate transport system substrate-binding protein
MIELKLYCTIATQPVVETLIPRFEAANGCHFTVVWNTAPAMVKRLQAGEQGDVLLLNKAGVETMKAAGRLAESSIRPIASSATAVAVKAGARRPDISSPDSFRQTLLRAKSISYSHPDAGGASGIYVAKLLQQWGIEREINAKTRFPPPAGLTAQFLLTGEAEIAIQQKPELMQVKGIEVVGFLPGDLHFVTHFVAGVDAKSTQPALAASFIDFLRMPDARELFTSAGLDPA